tara:strand:- start:3170 stop:4264 length:1095 start_codon:yes stop_codon:yes gene_type:complete
MAITIPSDYARNYAGAATGGGLSAKETLLKEFYPTPEESFKQDLFNSVNSNIDPILSAWGTDVGDWANINFDDITNPATAFIKFKTDILSEGGRKARYAKKNNLLDPVSYIQTYNERMRVMGPQLADKLINYQIENKLSMEDMQRIVSGNPGLTRVLKQFGQVKPGIDPTTGMENPVWEMMHPSPTISESWERFGKGLMKTGGNLMRPETAIPAGITGLGAKMGYDWLSANKPEWIQKTKDITKGPTTKAIKAIAPYAVNKTVGQVAKGILKGSGVDDKTAALGQEATEGAMSIIQAKIGKHGVAKVLGKVAKTLGWKAAAKTIGKFSAGALGAGATYGIGTGVMYTWLAKDLYDVYNIVKNMD